MVQTLYSNSVIILPGQIPVLQTNAPCTPIQRNDLTVYMYIKEMIFYDII